MKLSYNSSAVTVKKAVNEWYTMFLNDQVVSEDIVFFFTYQSKLLKKGSYLAIKESIAETGFNLRVIPSKATRLYHPFLFLQPLAICFPFEKRAEVTDFLETIDLFQDKLSLCFVGVKGQLVSLELCRFLQRDFGRKNNILNLLFKTTFSLSSKLLCLNLRSLVLIIKLVLYKCAHAY